MCTRRIVLISLCNCIGRCEYFGRHKSWSCMLNAIVEGMRKASMRRCKFSVALCAEKWMHFLWMRRRELNDIYSISYAHVCFSKLIRHSPKYVSLSLSQVVSFISYLTKVDHENLSSPRTSDISQTLFVVFPVGSFYFELALEVACATFEDVSPKETRPVEPLLQIVICVTSRRMYTYKDSR